MQGIAPHSLWGRTAIYIQHKRPHKLRPSLSFVYGEPTSTVVAAKPHVQQHRVYMAGQLRPCWPPTKIFEARVDHPKAHTIVRACPSISRRLVEHGGVIVLMFHLACSHTGC